MDYTDNLNLIKPAKAEQFNIDYHNTNSDIIDSAFKDEVDTRIAADTNLQEQINLNRNEERRIGTVPISKGGTGATVSQDALNNLHASVQTQPSIDAVDEVTFIKRTPADVSSGTEETIDVQDVTLDTLASKVFDLLKTNNNNLFSTTQNGFTPKSGNATISNFLRSDGSWAVPPRQGDDIVEVQSSNSYTLTSNTIFKITASSAVTIVITDPATIGLKVIFINNSNSLTHSLSTTNVEGSTVDSILPNSYFEMVWNGSAWVNISAPAVGSTFTQYPQQESPDVVYPCSKWTVIDYGGAFFRAEGGNAAAYINKTDVLNAQSDATAKNGLSLSNTLSVGNAARGGAANITDGMSGDNYAKFSFFLGKYGTGVGNASGRASPFNLGDGNLYSGGSLRITRQGANIDLAHTHHVYLRGSVSLGNGDSETRPLNYTMRIWKRIS